MQSLEKSMNTCSFAICINFGTVKGTISIWIEYKSASTMFYYLKARKTFEIKDFQIMYFPLNEALHWQKYSRMNISIKFQRNANSGKAKIREIWYFLWLRKCKDRVFMQNVRQNWPSIGKVHW